MLRVPPRTLVHADDPCRDLIGQQEAAVGAGQQQAVRQAIEAAGAETPPPSQLGGGPAQLALAPVAGQGDADREAELACPARIPQHAEQVGQIELRAGAAGGGGEQIDDGNVEPAAELRRERASVVLPAGRQVDQDQLGPQLRRTGAGLPAVMRRTAHLTAEIPESLVQGGRRDRSGGDDQNARAHDGHGGGRSLTRMVVPRPMPSLSASMLPPVPMT